jgi:hypothetical protein
MVEKVQFLSHCSHMLLKNVQTAAHGRGMFSLHVSIFQKLLGRNASSSISFGLAWWVKWFARFLKTH